MAGTTDMAGTIDGAGDADWTGATVRGRDGSQARHARRGAAERRRARGPLGRGPLDAGQAAGGAARRRGGRRDRRPERRPRTAPACAPRPCSTTPRPPTPTAHGALRRHYTGPRGARRRPGAAARALRRQQARVGVLRVAGRGGADGAAGRAGRSRDGGRRRRRRPRPGRARDGRGADRGLLHRRLRRRAARPLRRRAQRLPVVGGRRARHAGPRRDRGVRRRAVRRAQPDAAAHPARRRSGRSPSPTWSCSRWPSPGRWSPRCSAARRARASTAASTAPRPNALSGLACRDGSWAGRAIDFELASSAC